MVRLTACINFWGTAFDPTRTEQETGLLFTNKQEVGAIALFGRYRNQPLPHGSASVEAPESIEWPDRVLWLARQWVGKIEIARACGAQDIHFWVGYFYTGQGNCSLSVEEINAISALAIPYLFSVYQVDDLDSIP